MLHVFHILLPAREGFDDWCENFCGGASKSLLPWATCHHIAKKKRYITIDWARGVGPALD